MNIRAGFRKAENKKLPGLRTAFRSHTNELVIDRAPRDGTTHMKKLEAAFFERGMQDRARK